MHGHLSSTNNKGLQGTRKSDLESRPVQNDFLFDTIKNLIVIVLRKDMYVNSYLKNKLIFSNF